MSFAQVIAGVGDGKREVYGATEVGTFTITFGAGDTYVTNGLALTAASFGLARPIAGIVKLGGNTAAIVAELYWNTQTNKLMMYETNVGLASTPAPFQELPNATSIANFAYTVLVFTQR